MLNFSNGLFNLSKLFDGDASDNSTYNTEQPIGDHPTTNPFKWPAWSTFDMGQAARLSRFQIYYRIGGSHEFVWTSGAPQTWVMWGRADTPQDEIMPTDTTLLPPVGEMTANGWINMGVYDGPAKPADNPLTNADFTIWQSGFSYDFPATLPRIRYIRFECIHTMGGTDNFFNMNELSIYGNPNVQ